MKISKDLAKELLKAGSVVALPTETVYGLAASLSLPDAIEKIYSLKGRPKQNPLIVHIHHPDLAYHYTKDLPPQTEKLIDAFWPGPLTLILPANLERVPKSARGELPSVALRMPSHPIFLDILKDVGPLVAPSANLSGKPSATDPKHIEGDFGPDFPVVDGGGIENGIESTILLYSNNRWQIGRLGSISQESFTTVLGYTPEIYQNNEKKVLCPGSSYRHYSPNASLTLGCLESCNGDVILGYSDRSYKNASQIISIGNSTDPLSIMKNLYSSLRKLDELSIQRAFIDIDLPKTGLYLTIYERFFRASEKN